MEANRNGKQFKGPLELVCEFDVAKQLRDMGIRLETLFYYLYFPNTEKRFVYRNKTAFKTKSFNDGKGTLCELIPAPLSEEVLAIIPTTINSWQIPIKKGSKNKSWFAACNQFGQRLSGTNEATARVRLLILLFEKELLKPN